MFSLPFNPYVLAFIAIVYFINEYSHEIKRLGLIIAAVLLQWIIVWIIGYVWKSVKFSKLKNRVSQSTDYFSFLDSLNVLSAYSEKKNFGEKFSKYLEEDLVRNDAIKGLVTQALSTNIKEPKIREVYGIQK